MNSSYVDSKDDKKEEETIEAEEQKTENTAEEVEFEKETDDAEENEEFDYKEYGKETIDETKSIAEKMFNDVVSTLKSTQSEWNKTIEEYKANKPAVDLLEYEDKLVIKMDLPRVSKEDLSIKMSTDSVEIEVEFPETVEDEDVKVLRRERVSGKTKNVVPLPVEVDIKEVKATFADNELTLSIPKIKGRKVDVEIV